MFRCFYRPLAFTASADVIPCGGPKKAPRGASWWLGRERGPGPGRPGGIMVS